MRRPAEQVQPDAINDDVGGPTWYRRPLVWIGVAVLVIVGGVFAFVSSGGDEAADPVSGVYQGAGDNGFEIDFSVADQGLISELSMVATCGALTRNETITFTPFLPVEGGRFEVPQPASGGLGVDGRFVGDGTKAQGGWETGSCAGSWEAERVSAIAATTEASASAEASSTAEAAPSAEAPPSTAPEPDLSSQPDSLAVVDFEDDFDGALGEGWRWSFEIPEKWSLTSVPGTLEITALDTLSNVLVRPAPEAAFEVTTALGFRPTSNFQFAGLIVAAAGSEASWLQLGRAYCDPAVPDCVGDGVYIDDVVDWEVVGSSVAPITPDTDVIYLRFDRDGDIYTGYFSEDGESWLRVGQHTKDLVNPDIGLMAGQAYETPLAAHFDYFSVTSPTGGDPPATADVLGDLLAGSQSAGPAPTGSFVSCTDTEYAETATGPMIGAGIRNGEFAVWMVRIDGTDVEAEMVGECTGLLLGPGQTVVLGRQGPDSPWQSVGFYSAE